MTQAQKDELARYLTYCVKDGFIDNDDALELIRNEKWDEIQYLMDKGDAYEDYI